MRIVQCWSHSQPVCEEILFHTFGPSRRTWFIYRRSLRSILNGKQNTTPLIAIPSSLLGSMNPQTHTPSTTTTTWPGTRCLRVAALNSTPSTRRWQKRTDLNTRNKKNSLAKVLSWLVATAPVNPDRKEQSPPGRHAAIPFSFQSLYHSARINKLFMFCQCFTDS